MSGNCLMFLLWCFLTPFAWQDFFLLLCVSGSVKDSSGASIRPKSCANEGFFIHSLQSRSCSWASAVLVEQQQGKWRVAKLVVSASAVLACHVGEGRLLGCLSSQNLQCCDGFLDHICIAVTAESLEGVFDLVLFYFLSQITWMGDEMMSYLPWHCGSSNCKIDVWSTCCS